MTTKIVNESVKKVINDSMIKASQSCKVDLGSSQIINIDTTRSPEDEKLIEKYISDCTNECRKITGEQAGPKFMTPCRLQCTRTFGSEVRNISQSSSLSAFLSCRPNDKLVDEIKKNIKQQLDMKLNIPDDPLANIVAQQAKTSHADETTIKSSFSSTVQNIVNVEVLQNIQISLASAQAINIVMSGDLGTVEDISQTVVMTAIGTNMGKNAEYANLVANIEKTIPQEKVQEATKTNVTPETQTINSVQSEKKSDVLKDNALIIGAVLLILCICLSCSSILLLLLLK